MAEYLTLEEYEVIAKKILKASYPKVSKIILNDDEKFGEVVRAIMMGDWKWDGRGTLVGYRKQRVKWCIGAMYDKISKTPNTLELLDNTADISVENIYDLVDIDDKLEFIRRRALSSKILTDKEKKCISEYFAQRDIGLIAADLKTTKENVRYSIKQGLRKMGKTE